MLMRQFYIVLTSTQSAIECLQYSFDSLQLQLHNHKLVLNSDQTKWTLFSKATRSDLFG